jgi:hypothetical protein
MSPQDSRPAPNPVSVTDVSVLIQMLAVYEGYLMGDHLDDDVVTPVRDRFVREGLLTADSDERDFRQAVNDLNQRLRYTAGEYPEPIRQLPVAVNRRPGG